jgi:thioredoxin 1
MEHVNANEQNFQKEVLEVKGKVLVDFWAPWCGPCQMLSPVLEEIAKEMGEKVKVVKVNVDEEGTLAQQYNVSAIPTVVLFEEGKIKETFVGFRQKQEYINAVSA